MQNLEKSQFEEPIGQELIKLDLTNLQETITDYSPTGLESYANIVLIISLILSISSGIFFIFLVRNKIINFKKEKVTPLPLRNLYTSTSWILLLAGLASLFTITLQVFDFSLIKSLISSVIITTISGSTMWKVISDLLVQVERGEVKEIEEYF